MLELAPMLLFRRNKRDAILIHRYDMMRLRCFMMFILHALFGDVDIVPLH